MLASKSRQRLRLLCAFVLAGRFSGRRAAIWRDSVFQNEKNPSRNPIAIGRDRECRRKNLIRICDILYNDI
jgi:hypothetical protein